MKLQFNQTGNADKTWISHNNLHNYPINPKDAKVIKIAECDEKVNVITGIVTGGHRAEKKFYIMKVKKNFT